MNVTTGTGNPTYWFGCWPCSSCDGSDRYTYSFHGHWFTLCVHCGAEL